MTRDEALVEDLCVPECGGTRVHPFDSGRRCCIYDSESKVHDTLAAKKRREEQRARLAKAPKETKP